MEEENTTKKQECIITQDYITPQITIHEMELQPPLAASNVQASKRKTTEIEDMDWEEEY